MEEVRTRDINLGASITDSILNYEFACSHLAVTPGSWWENLGAFVMKQEAEKGQQRLTTEIGGSKDTASY